LFFFSSKAGSARGGNEGIEHRSIEVSSAGQASSIERKRQGKGAVWRNDSHQGPSSIRGRGRGHGQNSVKAKVNRVLLDSEAGVGLQRSPTYS
jgi:hypothetical protein